jgi:hypothetical protein
VSPVRRGACLFLLITAIVSAVGHAVYPVPTSPSGSVLLWAVIAMLAWDIMDGGEPGEVRP